MVTEHRQIATLSSKQIMSAKNVSLPCTNFNGLGFTLNSMSMSNAFKNSLKDDKKVEVRWLESESDLYLKQWQRRYRQLEGIDGNVHPRTWSKSYLLEHYEDWYLTARSILDIDVEYMNSKDFNKFNLENCQNQGFDFFFNREKSNFLFNIDDSLEDDGFEFEDNIMQFETITLDPTIEYNQEIISALKSSNLIFKNGKLEYFRKKGKNIDKEKSSSEKHCKKSQKAQLMLESINLVPDESSSVPSSDTSPSKSSSKSPRKVNTKQRTNRPPTARRQMYVCEYPGCSYQSDRNFNFLRHKRTHGKQKNDENKKLHNGIVTPSELLYESTHLKASSLSDSSFVGLELGSINNEILHLSSQSPLLSNELNLNLAQCNSINLSDNDPTFSLSDEFLERPNVIMKDINNLEHALSDNHFTSIALEQSFLS